MGYCMYLRKSRADEQAENTNRLDTLQRHEAILLELSGKLNIKIEKIFREIVSGDSIEARPVMQKLLNQVEKRLWQGVFVMEVERLARGDTVDQGIVARTFKYSGTKIITPIKIYDPNNEFDEEYFEFGLFMSRREYKVINRRLQRGRLSSVKEGKFTGSIAPYGYSKVKLKGEKGFTLEIDNDKASVVNLIFSLFLKGTENSTGYHILGISKIAEFLNLYNIPSPANQKWTPSTVHDILTNPVYTGKIRWNYRPAVKSVETGKVKIKRYRNPDDNIMLTNGLHQSIIDDTTFKKAQNKLFNYSSVPAKSRRTFKNPLAGIVICGVCGAKMVRKPYKNNKDFIVCPNNCGNVACFLDLLEEKLIASLNVLTKGYKIRFAHDSNQSPVRDEDIKNLSLISLKNKEYALKKQLSKVYSLFEQGIYSEEVFSIRRTKLQNELNNIKAAVTGFDEKKDLNRQVNEFFKDMEITEIYRKTTDPKIKNSILKELFYKIEYIKEKSVRWNSPPDAFEITIYPKLPQL